MASKRWKFACRGCKTEHEYAAYAIAQLSMGHELVYTCDCGAQTTLTRSKMDKDAKRAEEDL